jgi:hypothetical protein
MTGRPSTDTGLRKGGREGERERETTLFNLYNTKN